MSEEGLGDSFDRLWEDVMDALENNAEEYVAELDALFDEDEFSQS